METGLRTKRKKTYLGINIVLTVVTFFAGAYMALAPAATGMIFSLLAESSLKQEDPSEGSRNFTLARIFFWMSVIFTVLDMTLKLFEILPFSGMNGLGNWTDFLNNAKIV